MSEPANPWERKKRAFTGFEEVGPLHVRENLARGAYRSEQAGFARDWLAFAVRSSEEREAIREVRDAETLRIARKANRLAIWAMVSSAIISVITVILSIVLSSILGPVLQSWLS